MSIPNWLTAFRIALIPVFVVVFYMPFHWSHSASAAIFAIACITDWFDGYLARRLKQISKLGAFLDPVADKLVIAVALVLIVAEKHAPFLAIPAAIIVGREIVISALREWMAELGKRTSMAVSYIGKGKTLIQMVAVLFLLAYQPGSQYWLFVFGYILLYVAAILTLWSMTVYIKIAWPELVACDK